MEKYVLTGLRLACPQPHYNLGVSGMSKIMAHLPFARAVMQVRFM